jgi:hypothetical protein
MMKFYDPKDSADQARIEEALHKGGVEFSVTAAPANSGVLVEIEVAEEDVPRADQILQSITKK